MAMTTTIVGSVVSVVARKWDAFRDVKAGSSCGLWVLPDFGEDPVAIPVPDENGWRSALQTVKFGDRVTCEVRTLPQDRGNGRPGLRYQLLDIRLGKPEAAAQPLHKVG